jgi:cation diffusion facilitator CzcD-associated flavoprotein CzcO
MTALATGQRSRRDDAADLDHEIVIVGAGFAGIGTAIKLKAARSEDFVIIEAGDGVGGTWHWNTYPGIAVDIPSFSYQFSFEKRADWSRVYAPGNELKAYAEHCVDKYRLREKIRFNTLLTEAMWDEPAERWILRTGDGDTITTRFLINASGVLTQPKLPDIPGVDTFTGITMHTARWDHTVDLRGKRVAMIGTGASAVQIAPAIAPDVAHLTVFQRTPIWCLPKFDPELPGAVRAVLRTVPGGKTAFRALSQTYVEATFPFAAQFYGRLPIAKLFERAALRYLHQQVRDPELRAKLTPRYGLGCKRPGFHNSYYATYNRDNVTLETTPIERISTDAVITSDGTRHEIDVVILATGFRVMDIDDLPYRVVGVDSVALDKWWDEHRLQAYEGVSVPHFPNTFSVMGPYGYNGSSYFALIEHQVRHIMRVLTRARRVNATRVEVSEAANERYFEEMLARRGDQIFWRPSCASANSYYFDKHGDVPLRPTTTLESVWRSYRFNLDDYEFSSSSSSAG